MVIPGDKDEMNNFMECATDSSRIQIELHVPVLHLILPTKHVYEILYNRINSDLLLWEPNAPKPKTPVLESNHTYGTTYSNFQTENPEMFRMCKSGVQYGNVIILIFFTKYFTCIL